MEVSKYMVTLRHDKGVFTLATCATSEESAIRMVMKAQNAPRRAIIKIEKQK